MGISYYTAIGLVILTSFMWGFWHQFVKKLGNWPLSAFMINMYTVGLIVVWLGIFFFQEQLVPEGIAAATARAPGLCALDMLCGAGFAIGMQINLYVVSKMGLIFSTSIVSTSSIILGTLLSSVLGGIPEDTSFWRIFFGALILLAATLICQWAGRVRDADHHLSRQEIRKKGAKYLLILVIYLVFFSQSYTIGMSFSVQTDLNPDGLPGILAVGYLAVGAALATLLVSGGILIRQHALHTVFNPEKKICLLYAFIGGVCCLGGDFIHNIAAPVVSVAIAWPLCSLSGLWQYFWGITGGEFKGAGRRAKMLLAAGMSLFVVGIIWLTFARYVRPVTG